MISKSVKAKRRRRLAIDRAKAKARPAIYPHQVEITNRILGLGKDLVSVELHSLSWSVGNYEQGEARRTGRATGKYTGE